MSGALAEVVSFSRLVASVEIIASNDEIVHDNNDISTKAQ